MTCNAEHNALVRIFEPLAEEGFGGVGDALALLQRGNGV